MIVASLNYSGEVMMLTRSATTAVPAQKTRFWGGRTGRFVVGGVLAATMFGLGSSSASADTCPAGQTLTIFGCSSFGYGSGSAFELPTISDQSQSPSIVPQTGPEVVKSQPTRSSLISNAQYSAFWLTQRAAVEQARVVEELLQRITSYVAS